MKSTIEVQGVTKAFNMGVARSMGSLARIVSFLSDRTPKKRICVLRNVSLKVKPGEIIGVVGKNASGKSTLMRILAGIYSADSGVVRTDGKIVSLIGLNIGLKERLTMKDNIFLCCSLFGLPQKTIRKRFNSIVEFSELEDYVGTKIYQFSEGTRQRLAFSIAVHCNPEILLLDEVFEVGDKWFREKCSKRIRGLARKGACILFVSHELDMVKKHCSRTIWLDKGRIVKDGPCEEVLKEYVKSTQR